MILAYSGSCMRPAAIKKQNKHTEHERVQFWGATEHEGALHAHHTVEKHTQHEMVPYTHATR